MQVLQISHGIYPVSQAGTEIYTAELAEELSRQGVDVTVAVPASKGLADARSNGTLPSFVVPVERAPTGAAGNKLRYAMLRPPLWQSELRRLIHGVRPDVIHIQHAIGFGVSLFTLLNEFAIPVVITVPDYWLLCPGILRECNGDLAQCAKHCCKDGPLARFGYPGKYLTAVIHRRRVNKFVRQARPHLAAISRRTQDIFEGEGFPKRLLHTRPWGINVTRFRTGAHSPSATEHARIGYIGSVREHKGCHILASAFVQARPIGATLHFYGGGDQAYLESLKQRYAAADVIFHGRFDHASAPEILRNLDIVVIPSIWEESYCLVAQEALAARNVVIASDIGGLSDRLIEGVNAFLVPPNDVAALSAVISAIVPRLKQITELLDFDRGLLDIVQDAREWMCAYEQAVEQARASV